MSGEKTRDEKFRDFAHKHRVRFEDHGEVGFGRPCVGFLRDGKYIEYNPWFHHGDYKPVFDPYGLQVFPEPDTVPDAYHKHDCMAVLVRDDNYEEALRQLETWVDHLETQDIVVVEYKTGATGMQALFSGMTAWAMRLRSEVEGDA